MLAAQLVYAESGVKLFVSFSMPDQAIQDCMYTAKTIQASILIRGLVDNSFKKTALKLTQLITDKDKMTGVALDPTSFKQYGVNKVPAVVVYKDDQFDVLYGAVSVEFALKKIAAEQDAVSEVANQILSRMHHA